MDLAAFQHFISHGSQRWAALFDPDKHSLDSIEQWMGRILPLNPDAILYGGSQVNEETFQTYLPVLKAAFNCPVIVFPGDEKQLHPLAHGHLILSLLSGRNAEYLIGKHVKAARNIYEMGLNHIAMAYLLVDGRSETSAMEVTQTLPMDLAQPRLIEDTCLAALQLGFSHIYLEAGSGARQPVPLELIKTIKALGHYTLWVGGGIRSLEQRQDAWDAGANWVVMGNVFETNA